MSPSQRTYTKVTKRKKRYKRPGQTLCNNIIIWQTDEHEGFRCTCLAVIPKQGGKASDSQDRKLNSTHSLLLCKGASQQLTITNTIFCLANKRKILWMHSTVASRWQTTNIACGWIWGYVQMTITGNTQNSWEQQAWDRTANIYWTWPWRHAQGVLCSNDPKGILYQGVPN